jgi:hypothetical protein
MKQPARIAERTSFAGSLVALAVTVAATAVFPSSSAAQTPSASKIVEALIQRQQAELDHVQNYWVEQEQNGVKTTLYYEKRTVDGRPAFVYVPESEYIRKIMKEKGIDPQRVAGEGGGSGGSGAGGMPGMGGQGGGGNPLTGMRNSLMQKAMGKFTDQLARSGESLVTPDPGLMRKVAARATVTGSRKVNGHRAWVLEIHDFEGLDLLGDEGNMEDFTPKSATLLIDADRHVSLQDHFEGTVHSDGDHDVTFTIRYEDYRDVDGMLKPFRTVMEVGGMARVVQAAHGQEMAEAQKRIQEEATTGSMSRKQKDAQLQSIDRQIRELQERLDHMPADQRSRVEPMIQQQIAMMRRARSQMEAHDSQKDFQKGQARLGAMMSSSGFTMETVIDDMKVNAGPPEPEWMKRAEQTVKGGSPHD